MRYGTWNLVQIDDDLKTPDQVIGAFYADDTNMKIAGYIPESLDVDDFAEFNLIEITATEFETLFLSINPNGQIIDGKAWSMPLGVHNG